MSGSKPISRDHPTSNGVLDVEERGESGQIGSISIDEATENSSVSSNYEAIFSLETPQYAEKSSTGYFNSIPSDVPSFEKAFSELKSQTMSTYYEGITLCDELLGQGPVPGVDDLFYQLLVQYAKGAVINNNRGEANLMGIADHFRSGENSMFSFSASNTNLGHMTRLSKAFEEILSDVLPEIYAELSTEFSNWQYTDEPDHENPYFRNHSNVESYLYDRLSKIPGVWGRIKIAFKNEDVHEAYESVYRNVIVEIGDTIEDEYNDVGQMGKGDFGRVLIEQYPTVAAKDFALSKFGLNNKDVELAQKMLDTDSTGIPREFTKSEEHWRLALEIAEATSLYETKKGFWDTATDLAGIGVTLLGGWLVGGPFGVVAIGASGGAYTAGTRLSRAQSDTRSAEALLYSGQPYMEEYTGLMRDGEEMAIAAAPMYVGAGALGGIAGSRVSASYQSLDEGASLITRGAVLFSGGGAVSAGETLIQISGDPAVWNEAWKERRAELERGEGAQFMTAEQELMISMGTAFVFGGILESGIPAVGKGLQRLQQAYGNMHLAYNPHIPNEIRVFSGKEEVDGVQVLDFNPETMEARVQTRDGIVDIRMKRSGRVMYEDDLPDFLHGLRALLRSGNLSPEDLQVPGTRVIEDMVGTGDLNPRLFTGFDPETNTIYYVRPMYKNLNLNDSAKLRQEFPNVDFNDVKAGDKIPDPWYPDEEWIVVTCNDDNSGRIVLFSADELSETVTVLKSENGEPQVVQFANNSRAVITKVGAADNIETVPLGHLDKFSHALSRGKNAPILSSPGSNYTRVLKNQSEERALVTSLGYDDQGMPMKASCEVHEFEIPIPGLSTSHALELVIPLSIPSFLRKMILARVEGIIAKTPYTLLKNTDVIHIHTSSYVNPSNQEVSPSTAGTAWFDENTKKAMLDLYPKAFVFSTKRIIWHEGSHNLARKLFGSSKPNDLWIDRAKKDNVFMSNYAQENFAEDFAETVSYYVYYQAGILDPSIYVKFKNRFDYLNTEIFGVDPRKQIWLNDQVNQLLFKTLGATAMAGVVGSTSYIFRDEIGNAVEFVTSSASDLLDEK